MVHHGGLPWCKKSKKWCKRGRPILKTAPSQNYHKHIFRPAKVWLLDLKEKHVDQKIMKKNGESNTPFNMSAKDLENNRNDYASGCCGSIFGKSNRAKATGQHTTILLYGIFSHLRVPHAG